MNLHIGTSGYSYKEWKGTFYPEKLPAREMLSYYSQQFSSVEINNTFHRMPREEMLEKWASEVAPGFRFALKAPQRITHFQRLLNAEESLSWFLRVASILDTHLGPLLFQLPPNMKKDVSRLRDFMSHLPRDFKVAFEFRHESWFDEEVYQLLNEKHAQLCIAETENGLETPSVSTADWGYLRLRRPDYDNAKLLEWVKHIHSREWTDAFVFFKHEDEAKGPAFAKEFMKLVSERTAS